jgi:ribonuclease-3
VKLTSRLLVVNLNLKVYLVTPNFPRRYIIVVQFATDSPQIPPEVAVQVQNCESRIGYVFKDKRYLVAALTHASGAQHRLASNERLEFLGDAILGGIVCEMLYHQFPISLEGDLTRIKSIVVSRQTCAKLSESLGLESCLIVGKGMATSRPVPRSLLADMFESLVAAIYLDGGAPVIRDFVRRLIQPEIDSAASGRTDENYKSMLQQMVQRDHGEPPTYLVLQERGPDHDKFFRVAARIDGREFTPAWGQNKKEAEQRAACNAIAELAGELAPFADH